MRHELELILDTYEAIGQSLVELEGCIKGLPLPHRAVLYEHYAKTLALTAGLDEEVDRLGRLQ